ncbi:MAG: OmpH family outer membrane protein [Armatimonadetes bacterium]|nr:OmpH family outer membrane protein [Armatimonadota bacterium]
MKHIVKVRGSRFFGLLMVTTLALFSWGCTTQSPTKKVASIDQEKIFQLEEFKTAQKQIEDHIKGERDKLDKFFKDNPKMSDQEKLNKIQQMRIESQQFGNKIMQPLKTKAEAALAKVSRDKGAVVVLDKRIVVYGIDEITDDVVKVFQSKEEITLPEEQDATTSPIGYFDQEVVRSLKVFQEAEVRLINRRNELLESFRKKAPPLSPQEREGLQMEIKAQLEAYEEQQMTPLMQAVNETVKEVAAAEGLSLVLDKQHVMQGGRNMTREVVEAFLAKVGGEQDKTGGATPAPTPQETPTPGGG